MSKKEKVTKFLKDHKGEIIVMTGSVICVIVSSVLAKRSYSKGFRTGTELALRCLSDSIEDDKVFDEIISGMDKALENLVTK